MKLIDNCAVSVGDAATIGTSDTVFIFLCEHDASLLNIRNMGELFPADLRKRRMLPAYGHLVITLEGVRCASGRRGKSRRRFRNDGSLRLGNALEEAQP